MRQVVQAVAGGPVQVVDVPRPIAGPTDVLVRTLASVISPGTERAVTSLARSSLVSKARARPDLVRQVVRKASTEGLRPTARAVRSRLGGDVPLGYSSAGVVLEVGEHVNGIAPGQVVATGGAGRANHAEYQSVPGLLCAPLPEGVAAEDGAFATVGSIALHGIRLADVGAGGKVVVVGLGLIGQLSVRLAQASGCDVAAVDVDPRRVERAAAAGAFGLVEEGEVTTKALIEWSRGRGADAVLLTAATPSSAVVQAAPTRCRDRATIIVVGDVGLDLERMPFYERELQLRFARSYGPGRYERSYEDWGVDYPVGHVRWTEGRNLEAVLDLLASGRLAVDDLVTHRFPVADAPSAYALLDRRSEPSLAVLLTYEGAHEPGRPVLLRPSHSKATPGIGLVGAGAFASTVLLPSLEKAGFERFVAVASASGLSARRLGERNGFERAVAGAEAVIDDPDVDVVVIASAHDSHGGLAARALRGGKHVFCEKPLALSEDELDDVEEAWRASGRVLFVGFNRRYSPAVAGVRGHVAGGSGPLVVTYRVSAGPVAPEHWYGDRRQGGRLLGEVCHFVDTCGAIVGDDPSVVEALGSGEGEDDVVVAMRYPDGSLATISYASGGHQDAPKERIDVLGRGHSAVVDDFRAVTLDGRERSFRQDKGHVPLCRAFREAVVQSRAPAWPLTSSRATLRAAASVLTR
jgi:predicted dehydrogenase